MGLFHDKGGININPILETGRLILRPFTKADAPSLFEFLRDEEVNTFLPWFPAQTLEEAEAHLEERCLKPSREGQGCHYAVCLKPDGHLVGYVHINGNDSHDLGYGLAKAYWHQGFMTEACRALLEKVGQEGRFPYLTATHDILNPRSGRVMKQLGMVYCYSYREQVQPKNQQVVFRLYQLNFTAPPGFVYPKYRERFPHFIEKDV